MNKLVMLALGFVAAYIFWFHIIEEVFPLTSLNKYLIIIFSVPYGFYFHHINNERNN